MFLKIRKVRKKAAVILSIGAYGPQSGAGGKAANCSSFCPFLSASSYFYFAQSHKQASKKSD